jgi:glycosyltransferase involved in cell wall biosynthesis
VKTIYFVVPCYNEQEVLPETSKRLLQKLDSLIEGEKISGDSRIVFIDDGSRDETYGIISSLHEQNEKFCGIKLSRNHGHQNALLSGLMTVKDRCDAAISLDADLQDDIDAIDEFIDKFNEGYEVVYGVRDNRKSDSMFKRTTSQGFYKLLRAMGADVIYNHADYRLISARALRELANFKEVNLFLRGMVPLVGFKSTSVYYKRTERMAGKSHYPLRKMISLALDGITSLSIKPLQLISGLGIIMSVISFAFVIWAIVAYFLGHAVTGWASTVAVIGLVGGIQLICLGVIGEYIGKLYMEVKQRPRYIISERTEDDK